MPQILVVEDEIKLASAIAEGVQENGYEATVVHSAEAGLALLQERKFDVILLDVMLPRLGGLEMMRSLRRNAVKTPVLILTAKGELDDRVRGLDAGADDYLAKPFAFTELLARVRALHRRANPETPSVIQMGDLRIEMESRIAVRGGTVLDLTAREFDLLEYLIVNRGIVVSREMIARNVWQTPVRYNTLDNVIDVHIARIRKKLDDPFHTKMLHTVRGVGFVLRLAGEG
jgi:two-component system, OmpR family, copper resistance phosphate regulon response regulator CusR